MKVYKNEDFKKDFSANISWTVFLQVFFNVEDQLNNDFNIRVFLNITNTGQNFHCNNSCMPIIVIKLLQKFIFLYATIYFL